MDFSEIIGHQHLKSHLCKTIENGRIPHAQLFIGKTGTGILPMALAYANEILCKKHIGNDQDFHNCTTKVARLTHPDLHFTFPVNTNELVKKDPVSSKFSNEWRDFVIQNPYASLYDWYKFIGIEKKQGNINVAEANEIAKTLALKSYDGGYKLLIVWMAEKMNNECANKILKIVEEPPEKTVILMLVEQEENVLETIQSRCQKLQFPVLSEADISACLSEKHAVPENQSKKIARRANGDFNAALHLLANDEEDVLFEQWFVSWVRTAFRAKGNKQSIADLLIWSESLASQGRETQKKFLEYCLEIFRQALLKNYGAPSLLYFDFSDQKFTLEKFAPFVHEGNILDINKSIEDAEHHIERNGNAKIVFSDLSIQLTKLIHRKSLL